MNYLCIKDFEIFHPYLKHIKVTQGEILNLREKPFRNENKDYINDILDKLLRSFRAVIIEYPEHFRNITEHRKTVIKKILSE